MSYDIVIKRRRCDVSATAFLAEVCSSLSFQKAHRAAKVVRALRTTVQPVVEVSYFSKSQPALLSAIPQAADYKSLRALHNQMNRIEMQRFLAYRSVPALHQHCTSYRDALTSKILTLIEEEMGAPAPVPYALVSLGSDGRQEQTLITDQDYLLVYANTEDPAVEQYFASFGALLAQRLEEIGFKRCTGDIMPEFSKWRGSLADWQRRIVSMVRYENEDYSRNVMDLIILSDARFVAGDRPLAAKLINWIRELEREYFQAMWGMAKAASEMKVALTFFRRLWTERSGPYKGQFNLKLLAWAPLIMSVRILAMNKGIPATNTERRIDLLKLQGSLSAKMAGQLSEAYRLLTAHRVLLQIDMMEGRRDEAYHLDPATLADGEREQLRKALVLVSQLQKIIHTNFAIM